MFGKKKVEKPKEELKDDNEPSEDLSQSKPDVLVVHPEVKDLVERVIRIRRG